jgi:hypothetical protein
MITAYYTIAYLRKRDDGSYWSAVVLITAIVELNVGIVVGCMPVIQAALLSRFAKTLRFSFVRSLISHLSFQNKAYDRAVVSPGQYQELNMNGKPFIQTDVLQGADGKGNFMNSWL